MEKKPYIVVAPVDAGKSEFLHKFAGKEFKSVKTLNVEIDKFIAKTNEDLQEEYSQDYQVCRADFLLYTLDEFVSAVNDEDLCLTDSWIANVYVVEQ